MKLESSHLARLTNFLIAGVLLLACIGNPSTSEGQTVLFEDNFDNGLSDKWITDGLNKEDYRIRDGALELRLQTNGKKGWPMMKVDIGFSTAIGAVASVDVTPVDGDPLPRNSAATLCLTDRNGVEFRVRKTNINGYFVLAPGKAELIDKGQEGNPMHYTVKHWPAQQSYGPLKIQVRADYAYFQVGPNKDGKFLNLFHSAIQPSAGGTGFGLRYTGSVGDGEHWVRFDNFRVTK